MEIMEICEVLGIDEKELSSKIREYIVELLSIIKSNETVVSTAIEIEKWLHSGSDTEMKIKYIVVSMVISLLWEIWVSMLNGGGE